MNRSKKPLTKTLRKKITKTIRKDLQPKEDTPVHLLGKNLLASKTSLSAKRAKKAKIEQNHLLSMQKSMSRKKGRLEGKKLSKRTTPSEEIVGSVPSHPHKEGTRWVKTLQKQTIIKNSLAVKKIQKQR